jgi:hypothetical protein
MAGFRLRSFSTGCAPNGARSLPIRSCATRLSACSTAFPSRHPAPCNWPPRLPGPLLDAAAQLGFEGVRL